MVKDRKKAKLTERAPQDNADDKLEESIEKLQEAQDDLEKVLSLSLFVSVSYLYAYFVAVLVCTNCYAHCLIIIAAFDFAFFGVVVI